LVKAIAPDAKIKIVGIRPGEKLHEEMITVSDAMNTVEFDDYYVIVPSILKWRKSRYLENGNKNGPGKTCPDGFSYNSGNNKKFLTVEEITELIKSL